MHLDRRSFLRAAGMAAGAFFLPSLPARAMRGRPDESVLVVLFLVGGADGLNLVVPRGDPHYALLRPRLGLADAALALDGFFALHPALAPLRPLYRRGELAFVHAVGGAAPVRSHFQARDLLETAAPRPGAAVTDGWLNRALALLQGGAPWSGIRLGHDPNSRALRGPTPHLRVGSLADFRLRGGAAALGAPVLGELYAGPATRLDPAVREAALAALAGVDELRAMPDPDYGAFPNTPFGNVLADAAALVRADIGVRVVTIALGGWDHHHEEAQLLDLRCTELAEGLAAFRKELAGRWDRTLVLGMTEFGRTAAENGSGGTDHGHGSVVLALGGRVRGDRVVLRNGRWPGLSPQALHQGRDLAVTTDVRDVFAEVLVRHLGLAMADLSFVLPGFPAAATRFPGILV